ncbi:hypothetical protein, partial [Phocaeicola sp.]|uniref:hypothetical protein n=1 Tax=Phocaeicola sp. TaxID=2773926 RepID=UPI00386FCDC5
SQKPSKCRKMWITFMHNHPGYSPWKNLSTSCPKACKYGIFCFSLDTFYGTIRASKEEWKTDGKD